MKNPAHASKKPLVQCPECHSPVRCDRLEKHIERMHRAKGVPAGKQTAAAKKKKSNHLPKRTPYHGRRYEVVYCPICEAPVYQRELQEHIDRFHPASSNNSEKTTQSKPNPQAYSKQASKQPPNGRMSLDGIHLEKRLELTIDESGFITTRDLWVEENLTSDALDRLGAVSLPKKETEKPEEPIFVQISRVSEEPMIKPSPFATDEKICCPLCRSEVRGINMRKHLKKVHPRANLKEVEALYRQGKKKRSNESEQDATIHHPKDPAEALRQSHDEPRYGGKYLGHMRREHDGKFGSLPLYDEYDDEADAK